MLYLYPKTGSKYEAISKVEFFATTAKKCIIFYTYRIILYTEWIRGQKTEDRTQRTEDGGQMTEDGRRRTEGGMRNLGVDRPTIG